MSNAFATQQIPIAEFDLRYLMLNPPGVQVVNGSVDFNGVLECNGLSANTDFQFANGAIRLGNAYITSYAGFNLPLIPEVGFGIVFGTGGTPIKQIETGLATMVAGTIPVADTDLTAGSTIQLTPGFAPAGFISYAKNPGVGFTINSTNAADAGEISWTRKIL